MKFLFLCLAMMSLLTSVACHFPAMTAQAEKATTCTVQACTDAYNAKEKGSYVSQTKLTCCVGLLSVACNVIHPVAPTPGAGGSAATGGATSTGGSSSTPGAGGSAATGGASSTGGTTSTTIDWLACSNSMSAKPTHHMLSGWHKSADRAKHARWKASYNVTSGSVFWAPNVTDPLDQGDLGSCTGNAMAQCLSSKPFTLQLGENSAVAIYGLATTLDAFPGTYPPDDTGSDGQSAALAAKKLGFTTLTFAAVDTLEGLQVALQRAPCVIGMPWWSGMSAPTACGEMKRSGYVEGGHEEALVAWDSDRKTFVTRNSWGKTYGKCRSGASAAQCGYAYMSAGTLQQQLNDGAEIDCPVMP